MTALPDAPDRRRVVAVPGLGLGADVPGRLLRLLDRPASTVELPAYGLPAPPAAPSGPADLARLLLDRLDGPDAVAPVVLLGHSASCAIVTQVAVRRPDRVAALVLVGPSTDPRGSTWPALAGRWLRTAVREHPGQLPVLLRDYRRTGLRCMRRGMEANRRHRLDLALADVRCPVLVVRGTHDAIAPGDWTRTLAATTPLGTHRTLDGGAHMVPITHPQRLTAVVEAFLQALPAAHR